MSREPLTIVTPFPGWIGIDGRGIDDCSVSTDPSLLPAADAVVFHVPTMPLPIPFRKARGQTWVAWSAESEAIYPVLADRRVMRRFDLTVTYRRDADVVLGYCSPDDWLPFRPPPLADSREAAPAVYLSSSAFDRSGRTDYVRELMRHLPVDSYGSSLQNRVLPADRGHETKLATLARYRFTLAFENSVARDYVTEKFYDPLLVGSVPVYLGAPNVAEHAPAADSYIDVRDFDGPAALAQHLRRLVEDEEEYARYLAWRGRPLSPAFVARVEEQREPALGRLCRLLRSRSKRRLPGRR